MTVLVPAAAAADAGKCRSEIVKAAVRYDDARIKALARCEDKVTGGKLPPATVCATDAAVVAALGTAATKLNAAISNRCGGDDQTCGSGGDDDSLASIGWDIGVCPDLLGQGCANPIADCGDIATCLECMGGLATDQLGNTYFGSLDVPSGDGKAGTKCQRTIGRESTKFFRKKIGALRKCWDAVNKGKAAGPCPAPGDGKAAAKIAALEAKLIAKVCKACGGADKACDGDVLGVAGSGNADDMSPAGIGWGATCDDVTIPGAAASCAAPVTSLADLVTCAHCVTNFSSDCLLPAAVPWATAYPPECGGAAASCGSPIYAEDFTGADGSPWPAPWTELAASVEVADLQGGRARFRPASDPVYPLGRLEAAGVSETDVEVTFTVEFEDLATQGVGFYVRSNGGYLTETVPQGQGYGVFVEGFRGFEGIGVWYEENGIETSISIDMGLALDDGVAYRVRFRVSQADASSTWLRARIWEEGDPEPAAWNVEALDFNPVLQNVAGSLALDSWSSVTEPFPIISHTFVDDIEVTRLCNPMQGIGAVTAIAETFQFLEGPRWRPADGELLFTDIAANTIYRLTPPATIDVFRTPSNNANGLATDVNGDLLVCEHASRSVTRTDSVGAVTTVAGDFGGSAFNSPNDIAVHSNGTMYFTDPRYGLPGLPELAFNGLFRRQTDGTLTAEFSGDPVNNGPNGVDLSPDESLLYMTDTETGELLAWDVAPDGSLSGQRTIASGMTIPDGMCVDSDGNVYVATWANSVEVFDADGTRWGSIAIPRSASNCAFGGADGTTLYVTAMEGLYAAPVSIPGIF
jgi:gluconolactonase